MRYYCTILESVVSMFLFYVAENDFTWNIHMQIRRNDTLKTDETMKLIGKK